MKNNEFLVVMISALALCGCATGAKYDNDAISKSYKHEVEEYNKVKEERKLSPSPSLWTNGGNNSSLFLDYKTRSIGEIVTINIMESSFSTNSVDTNTTKEQSTNSSADSIFGIPLSNYNTKSNSNSKFKGGGKRSKSDSVTGTMSARVVDVMPSGNVVLEGHKEILVDNQQQVITLSGIARLKDITLDNTINSTDLADTKISYNGKGQLSLASIPGWLLSILGWISPF
ncbi:MAG: flagellar basal body L-ring protein FlgH [Deferribacterales bacterium]